MKVIKMRKGTERLPVDFQKEMYIRTFKEIVYKFNNEQNLENEVYFNNSEIKAIIGNNQITEFMNNFHTLDTRKECFHVLGEEWIVRGGMFSSKQTKAGVGFMINPYWKDYFYSKMDIELWHSVKGKKKELEKLVKKKVIKTKLLDVMTDYVNHDVKGRYNQRLLSLLNGMRGSGKFIMNYLEFKEVLEIPKTYKSGHIDQQILNKAKTELIKANILITDIEKVKKGRSIDKIIIRFKDLNKLEKKVKVIKEETKNLSPEEIAIEKTLTKLFLKMNGYTLRDLGDIEINNELKKFVEENK